MRSDDGGFNWHTINKGLSFVRKWRENPSGADFRRDVLVALSPSFQRDGTLFAGSPAGDGCTSAVIVEVIGFAYRKPTNRMTQYWP